MGETTAAIIYETDPMSRLRETNPEAVPIDRIETNLRHVARLARENPVYLPIFKRLLAEYEAAKTRQADLDLLEVWAA